MSGNIWTRNATLTFAKNIQAAKGSSRSAFPVSFLAYCWHAWLSRADNKVVRQTFRWQVLIDRYPEELASDFLE